MTLDQAVALSLRRRPAARRAHRPAPRRRSRTARTGRAARGSRARACVQRAADGGIHVLAWNDPRFPAALLAISRLPAGALVSRLARVPRRAGGGDRRLARRIRRGARNGRALRRDLAARGVTVVSGLARGVDSAAHRGALDTGRTVAVLGSGVDRIYPSEHATLARSRSPDAASSSASIRPARRRCRFTSRMRNRLISGLSRAVVVIEASEKSGSLITAACALEQGRDVMAVPGNVLSGRNRGGHALIRDGAKIVECADDIVEELGLGRACRPRSSRVAGKWQTDQRVPRIRCCAGWTRAAPTISTRWRRASGLDAPRLLPHLADLELRGLVRRVGGGRFMRQS